MNIQTHTQLIVWQKAMDLVTEIYALTEHYPKTMQYELTAQTCKSAVSIPSNIAEGRRRGSKREFHRFLRIAFGSGAELETQLMIAKRLPWATRLNFSRAESLLSEVMRMLNTMIYNLKAKLYPSS